MVILLAPQVGQARAVAGGMVPATPDTCGGPAVAGADRARRLFACRTGVLIKDICTGLGSRQRITATFLRQVGRVNPAGRGALTNVTNADYVRDKYAGPHAEQRSVGT
ncbi:hypothetical protein [Verrucosispora sp. WMMD1129]|uniref:hypothetical protein n=1 Tax=Verrucosispora sp. WMMD1129 TaxID=3016093 RepID=UPI00249CEF52|nr:hypothetical protein [Verrucosispora sp. WMMD1129]WFE43040.1 hypothetical protein O7624_01310 [Verrucosispora sp. WMMD1129]